MRALWITLEASAPHDLKESLLKASKDLCDAVVVEPQDVATARAQGVQVASPEDGDILILTPAELDRFEALKREGKRLCLKIVVTSRSDEDTVVDAVARGTDYLLITCPDWKIIPLENLIAKTRGQAVLLAAVASLDEARVALETLELGVDGVVLTPSTVADVEAASALVKGVKTREGELAASQKIEVTPAKILACTPLSMGLRACIDTCDILQPGEGMLVGCQSAALFLIQGEVEESHYVEPRPFRVNAGPIALYVLTPNNKTRYLSELRAGDEVVIVDREGNQRTAVVGRVKIERRPLTLVKAEIAGRAVSTIVQNAETIRFMTPDASKSVVDLAAGDEVLVHATGGGRHFGVSVAEEWVLER
jgi:3-dehydroquinate synthase II